MVSVCISILCVVITTYNVLVLCVGKLSFINMHDNNYYIYVTYLVCEHELVICPLLL